MLKAIALVALVAQSLAAVEPACREELGYEAVERGARPASCRPRLHAGRGRTTAMAAFNLATSSRFPPPSGCSAPP